MYSQKSPVFQDDKKNSALYQVYYQFALDNCRDSTQCNEIATLLENGFNQGTHFAITTCVNLTDGIGDYVSQVYYIEKLNRIFKDKQNVKFQNISLIANEQLPIAKFVRNGKISEDDVLILEPNTNTFEKQNIVGIPVERTKQKLNIRISRADFIFNLAIPFVICKGSKPFALHLGPYTSIYNPCMMEIDPRKDCFIETWTQYCFLNRDYPRESPFKGSDSYNGTIFSEYSMGFHENQLGIRFIDDIAKAVNNNKNQLINDLSDELRNKITIKNVKDLETQSIAICYLQSSSISQAFALTACQASCKTGSMNLITNTTHFNSLSEDYKTKIKDLGFSTIEIMSGDSTQTIELMPKGTIDRTLRLIEFKGISNQDKNALYGLSETIGGSGDTSLSELFTAGLTKEGISPALPFFQIYLTSYSSCIKSILEEVEAYENISNESYGELKEYLAYLDDSQTKRWIDEKPEIISNHKLEKSEWIKNNRDKIVTQWRQFCYHIYEKRNIEKKFNELITTYTFHHLIKNDRIDEVIKIASMLDKNCFKRETLLHLAIKLNKVEAAKKIIEAGLSDINQPHIFNLYSPLQLAIHYQSIEMVKMLVEMGADINYENINHHNVYKTATNKKFIGNISDIISSHQQKIAESKNIKNTQTDVQSESIQNQSNMSPPILENILFKKQPPLFSTFSSRTIFNLPETLPDSSNQIDSNSFQYVVIFMLDQVEFFASLLASTQDFKRFLQETDEMNNNNNIRLIANIIISAIDAHPNTKNLTAAKNLYREAILDLANLDKSETERTRKITNLLRQNNTFLNSMLAIIHWYNTCNNTTDKYVISASKPKNRLL